MSSNNFLRFGAFALLLSFMLSEMPIVHGQQAAGVLSNPDLPDGARLRLELPSEDPSPIYQVRFSPDGRLLAGRDADQTIRIWDAATGQQQNELLGHEDRVRLLEFSPDGQLLVTASPSEAIYVWDISEESLTQRIDVRATALAFENDGSLLVAAARSDGVREFQHYDIETGERLRASRRAFPWRMTEVMSLNPNASLFAYLHQTAANPSLRYEVAIGDLKNGRVLAHKINRDAPAMMDVAPTGDAAVICFRSRQDGVTLFDLRGQGQVFVLSGLQRQTLHARFSDDGRILATGSWDGKVRLWEVLTRSEVTVLNASHGNALTVEFSPDGMTLVTTGGAQGGDEAYLWDVRKALYGSAFGSAESETKVKRDANGVRRLHDLKSRDSHLAFAAIGEILSLGSRGLEICHDFVEPMSVRLSESEIDQLIAELGATSFEERERAYKRLQSVRRVAADQLTAAIESASTLEIELRLKKLLSNNEVASLVSDAEYRQLYRMIQLLELFDRPEARALVSRLATTHIDSRISELATESLERTRTNRSDPDA